MGLEVGEHGVRRVQRRGHVRGDQKGEAGESQQQVEHAAGVGDEVEELGHGNLRTGDGRT
jgi:hypothetical protein